MSRPAPVHPTAGVTYVDSELYLTSERHARFSWSSREVDDATLRLDGELCAQLLELELEPEAYGRHLFRAVFPTGSPLHAGLQAAYAGAEGVERRLRLRLHLASGVSTELRELCWELLFDPEHKLALARSPDTAFSRYCTLPLDPGQALPQRPRLLGVVAAPDNVARYQMASIDRALSHQQLAAAFSALSPHLDFELLEPPATPGRLREQLRHGGYHALHIFGHGFARRGRSSSLILEDEQGAARFVDEAVLAEIFLGNHDLRLVTLVACHGGALSSNEAFSGLAARLVERGVPAVIGMSRALTFDAADIFTTHLYRNLARTGHVDVAVNEARQQLFLSEPKDVTWSSPILYMRLPDGLLWRAEPDAGADLEPPPAPAGALAKGPRSWFVQAALALVTLALGLAVWPAATAEADLELLVSRVGFQLAKPQPVVEHLNLHEVAASFLHTIQLPAAPGLPPQTVRRDQVRGPLGLRLAADLKADPASTLSLQMSFLPAGQVIALEHLEAAQYRLSIDTARDGEGRPLAADPKAEHKVRVSVAISGRASIKMLHTEARIIDAQRPETVEFQPQRTDLNLNITLAPAANHRFTPSIEITDLGLVTIHETPGPASTFFEQVSTIRSGTLTLTQSGIAHPLKPGEQLRFSRVVGSIHQVEPRDTGIALSVRGVFENLEAQVPGGTKLRPTVLGLWVGQGPGRVLLLIAVLLLVALLLSLTPLPSLFAHIHRKRLVRSHI